jgi:hypothetical protein
VYLLVQKTVSAVTNVAGRLSDWMLGQSCGLRKGTKVNFLRKKNSLVFLIFEEEKESNSEGRVMRKSG